MTLHYLWPRHAFVNSRNRMTVFTFLSSMVPPNNQVMGNPGSFSSSGHQRPNPKWSITYITNWIMSPVFILQKTSKLTFSKNLHFTKIDLPGFKWLYYEENASSSTWNCQVSPHYLRKRNGGTHGIAAHDGGYIVRTGMRHTNLEVSDAWNTVSW